MALALVAAALQGASAAAPAFKNMSPALSAVGSTSFVLSTTLDAPGTVYYVIVPTASATTPMPTSTAVKQYTVTGKVASGKITVPTANTAVTSTLGSSGGTDCGEQMLSFYGLAAMPLEGLDGELAIGGSGETCGSLQTGTPYTIYVVATDPGDTLNSGVRMLSGTPGGGNERKAPVFYNYPQFPSFQDQAASSVRVRSQTDVPGKIYFAYFSTQVTNPTAAELRSKIFSSSGEIDIAVGGTEVLHIVTSLQPSTTYYFYFTTTSTPVATGRRHLLNTATHVSPWVVMAQMTTTTPAPPGATLATTAGGTTNLDPIPVTVTFTTPISGFSPSKLTVANGLASPVFTGSGAGPYNVNIKPAQSGVTVQISLPANAVPDAQYGIGNAMSNTLNVGYDNVVPTVSLVVTQENFPFTVSVKGTFSKRMYGFVEADIDVVGATVNSPTLSIVNLPTSTEFAVQLNLGSAQEIFIKIPTGAAADIYGNGNTESNTLKFIQQGYHAGNCMSYVDDQGRESCTPWGKTMCLTPKDVLIGKFNSESGAVETQTFRILYEEYNLGASPISARRNTISYDGTEIVDNVELNGMNAIVFKPNTLTLGQREITDARIPLSLMGNTLDGKVHNFTVTLDSSGPNKRVSSTFVRFCGFEAAGVDWRNATTCTCMPDLTAGSALGVGVAYDKVYYGASLPATCLRKTQLSLQGMYQGFKLTVNETEASGILGNYAKDLKMVGSRYAFQSTVYLDSEQNPVFTTGLKNLTAGGIAPSTGFFIPSVIDAYNHKFIVKVDVYNTNMELSEANTYIANFKYCWPPDLSPKPNITIGNMLSARSNTSEPYTIQLSNGLTTPNLVCVYPEDVVYPQSNSTNVFVNVTYLERNIGIENLVGPFINRIYWDGKQVYQSGNRPDLPGGTTRTVSATALDFGTPDGLIHGLSVALDATNYVTNEDSELNNNYTVNVKFCEFGADIVAIAPIEFGRTKHIVPWGGTVCLTDTDIAVENMDEHQGAQLFPIKFVEANIGEAKAQAGYSNYILYDDQPMYKFMNRPELPEGYPNITNASRVLDLPQGVRLFPESGWNQLPHKLTISMDHEKNVLYELNTTNTFNITVRFCMSFLPRSKCGCYGDLTSTELWVGSKTAKFGQNEKICLEPDDFVVCPPTPGGETDANQACFKLMYSEANVNPYSLKEVDAGYVNSIYYDGVMIHTTSIRPQLDIGQTRYNVTLGDSLYFGLPDKNDHQICVVMDKNNDSLEIDEQNTFCVPVQWCGFVADLDAGVDVTVGKKKILWGDSACLTNDDYLIMPAGENDNDYAIEITYTERNNGYSIFPAGYQNSIYIDGVAKKSDSNRPVLYGKTQRQRELKFSSSSKELMVDPQQGKSVITLVMDSGDSYPESNENNTFSVTLYFQELMPDKKCPDAPPATTTTTTAAAAPPSGNATNSTNATSTTTSTSKPPIVFAPEPPPPPPPPPGAAATTTTATTTTTTSATPSPGSTTTPAPTPGNTTAAPTTTAAPLSPPPPPLPCPLVNAQGLVARLSTAYESAQGCEYVATLGMELRINTEMPSFSSSALVGEVALQLNVATNRVAVREVVPGSVVAKVDVLPPSGQAVLNDNVAKLMVDVFVRGDVKLSSACGGPVGRWQEGVCTYTAKLLYLPSAQAAKLVSSPPPPTSKSDSGLSDGAIAGIAIVCAVVPAIAVGVGCWLATRKARSESSAAGAALLAPSTPSSGEAAEPASPPATSPEVVHSAPVAPEPSSAV